jgi:AraC-like DNA-binding protein
MTGSKLVHVWEQGTCPQHDIYEITIHIDPDTFRGTIMDKRAFASIRRMLERAQRGLAFPEPAIQILREDIVNLAQSNDSFASIIRLWNLLYRLSLVDDARELSSSSFIESQELTEDLRIEKIKQYIAKNYMRDISIQDLADMIGMNVDAFSRFFKNKTGRTPNRYLNDYRLGIAARMLLKTKQSVSEIGFACGFNTICHFNRLFRESKGCTPSEFRERF